MNAESAAESGRAANSARVAGLPVAVAVWMAKLQQASARAEANASSSTSAERTTGAKKP